jgi:hypothetical protein
MEPRNPVLDKLKEEGRIKRVDGRKTGHWEVLEDGE